MAITIILALMHAVGGWQMPLWRDHAAFSVISMAMLVLSGGCMGWLWYREQKRAMLVPLVGLVLFAYVIEMLGVHTGFPYGEFVYRSGIFGPSMFGIPAALPFAWVPLVLGVAALMQRVAVRWKPVACIAGLLLVDAVLDPVAVRLGLWTYTQTAGWFGVPWTNYLGWCVSGAVGAWLVHRCAPTDSSGWMRRLFGCTLVFWVFAALRLGLWVPGVIGMAFGAYALYQGVVETRC